MTTDWRDRDWVKPAEYADIVGMSRNSVYNGIRSGDIPSIRTGPRSIRIPTAALKQLEDTSASTD